MRGVVLPPGQRLVGVFVAAIIAVQLTLPDSVSLGPLWLVPLLEGLAVVSLVIPTLRDRSEAQVHAAAVAVGIVLVLATVANAVLLLRTLFEPTRETGGQLLAAGLQVLVINVLSFACIYWRIDSGGPQARAAGRGQDPDFLFPQQSSATTSWRPQPIDYLFTAFTNIVAFSPTDTMPLRQRTKLLFMLQASVSMVTIVVTLSRAINMMPSG
ncbi:MAG: hypothetical protein R2737_10190 [Candidatus Nanopelagicales bacterium]